MTRILSDNDSQILTAPYSDPWRVEGGVVVQDYCHCISWEKATTIKMWLFKMQFFLCFRPTKKIQGGSPIDPLFEPPANPPCDSTFQKLLLSSFRHLWKKEFTRRFSKSSRELLPSSLWHEPGTQRKLFRQTCSDELFILGVDFPLWSFRAWQGLREDGPEIRDLSYFLLFGDHHP